MGDQDFSAPGGVYGPIGSNMPSSSGPHTVVSTMAIRLGYDYSPLSSPRLPHPPPLPGKMKRHPSDIWIPPPYGGPGPRMHHVAQVIPSPPPFGLPFPPQPHHHAPFPQVIQGPKPSDPAHNLQRGAVGHPPKPHGESPVPNMRMRHGMPEDLGFRMGNGAPAHLKRWSVPSFPGGQPPYFPPGVGDHTWGPGWPKQGVGLGPGPVGNKAVGGGMNGQPSCFGDVMHGNPYGNKIGGNTMSLSDTWAPHWTVPPGGQGFPSPPTSRFNGLSLPVTQSQEDRRKVKAGRSISCVTEPSWSSLSRELEMTDRSAAGGADLQQLMKSLDIGSEHMQSLKVKTACTCLTPDNCIIICLPSLCRLVS